MGKKKRTTKTAADAGAEDAGEVVAAPEKPAAAPPKAKAPTKQPDAIDKSKITLKDAEKLQAEMNLGIVGHVDHGKTTLTQSLSGVWTDRYSEEVERGISIKLGYADIITARCTKCPDPDCYWTKQMIKDECIKLGKKNVNYDICPACGAPVSFLRKIAIVDAPGHEILMATMLSGASLMDGALLLVAADEKVPQPQTKEHLAALEILNIKNIVIVQNKIDAQPKEKTIENFKQLMTFIKGTKIAGAPIVPVSAVYKVNLHALVMYIETVIPTPARDPDKPTRFYVARSFDVNKPGITIDKLQGGVIGGSLGGGKLRVGDEIELRPGLKLDDRYIELTSTIETISVGSELIEEAGPGGLLGIKTRLDPSLTKSDGLIGNVLGKRGELPPATDKIAINVTLMDYVLGAEDTNTKVDPLRGGENLMISIGTSTVLATITQLVKGGAKLDLKRRVCADPGVPLAVSRMVRGSSGTSRWRLIGYGTLRGNE